MSKRLEKINIEYILLKNAKMTDDYEGEMKTKIKTELNDDPLS